MACPKCGAVCGEYGAPKIRTLYPFSTPRWPESYTKWIDVDGCLLQELLVLWSHGIKTVEHCCGHGINEAYFCVEKDYYGAMNFLGYRATVNEFEAVLFVPHSVTGRKI